MLVWVQELLPIDDLGAVLSGAVAPGSINEGNFQLRVMLRTNLFHSNL